MSNKEMEEMVDLLNERCYNNRNIGSADFSHWYEKQHPHNQINLQSKKKAWKNSFTKK